MNVKGALMLSEKDNVATAIEDLAADTDVPVRLGREVRYIKAIEEIPFGFKMAITEITKDSAAVKYGEKIGVATSDIKKGAKVHIHNLAGARGRGDLEKGGDA
jgi:altronate dehydratase small subunit